MKSVLLDHCVPRPFGKTLLQCIVSTAYERGWAELTNGQLIDAAEAARVHVLIKSDKNLRYQQNLLARRIAIIELPTNRLREIAAYAEKVNALLINIAPGGYEIVLP